MAIFSQSSTPKPSHLPLIFTFLILTLTPSPISSLSFQSNFDSDLSLFGDAAVSNANSPSIQLTLSKFPKSSSSGLLIHTNPFKFYQSNPNNPISFSTDFTFSISPHNGDGLALIIVPTDFPSKFSRKSSSFGLSRESRFLGIEFDTLMDGNVGDLNDNHVGIDVSSLVSARVCNVSSVNLVLNSGVKLQSWLDYDASSKRLEVRLSKAGSERPYDPLLVYQIDLSKMWKDDEVFIGLSSSSGNSLQSSSVYSWNFRTRAVPKWMHSHPVNPQLYSDEVGEGKTAHKKGKKGSCFLGMLSGLAFGIGCGALAALALMYIWAIFVDRDEMTNAADCKFPVGFRYEKVNVVVENSLDDAKK
ncbi:hypothetical protein LguiA_034879 [Lonicera macranthoides]